MNRTELLLSAQRALLGNVGRSIRAIFIEHPPTARPALRLVAYVDDDVADRDTELLGVALAEVAADFGEAVSADLEVRRGDVADWSVSSNWVFIRSDQMRY